VVVALASPFGAEELDEVPLGSGPLVRVICQVSYPKIVELTTPEGIGRVASALRQEYPVLREERALGLVITPEGIKQTEVEGQLIWRLQDTTDVGWQVSLTPSFVSLDTRLYSSRDAFLDRLGRVLEAVATTLAPAAADRIGVRYFNRIEGPFDQGYDTITTRFGPPLHAGLNIPLTLPAQLQHSIVDTLFKSDGDELRARWGLVPAGTIVDPGVPASVERTWILDIDAYTTSAGTFSAGELTERARHQAESAHRFFRWSLTGEGFDLFRTRDDQHNE
jgi:uncharacterized protein (TIGR04255 family)